MKTTTLILAVHNHQPIGNFDTVFEEAYKKSYQPFIEVLEHHPSIRFSQHWTGPLLEWLQRHHPEFVERLKVLVHSGQLEILTGAHYESVLAIIPEADRIGQIRKLTETIHRTFDVVPRGLWLAERVWEQHLVESLGKAGVEFVVVDDTHFKHAGLRDEQLLGYYVTEELGVTLKVLPIDKTLRYTVPFRDVEETIRYAEDVRERGGAPVIVHADDGEKFGLWPKTFKHVYSDGWLERFCRSLEDHALWLRTEHFSSVIDGMPPVGRVYLPTSSYAEMTKWALDPVGYRKYEDFDEKLREFGLQEEYGAFVHGGFWRNFLAKYPEANQMHKRMLRISRRAHETASRTEVPQEVFDHLWAAQCNDPYWHGVFGGLYLPNLRLPVYRNLVAADTKLDSMVTTDSRCIIEEADFDCDGFPELIVSTSLIEAWFKPSLGGSLVELDFKPATVNLLDILSRREEGAHRKLLRSLEDGSLSAFDPDDLIAKHQGLEQRLHVDWYRHASLVDHLFPRETMMEEFEECRHKELGDFVNQPYRSTLELVGEHAHIMLERKGAVWEGEIPHGIAVRKQIVFAADFAGFDAFYTVSNLEDAPTTFEFGVELALGSMAGDAEDRFYHIEGALPAEPRLRSRGIDTGVSIFSATDQWLRVEVEFNVSKACTLWRFPLETVSLSESGFELLYQGSILLPHWTVSLARVSEGEAANVEFKISQRIRHW
jgi:4-alpha-glucanotransferase